MSHMHAAEMAASPRPDDVLLAGELRFQVVGRLKEEARPEQEARRKRRLPWISMAVLGAIVLGCLLADVLAPGDPAYMDLLSVSRAPCAAFPFGTDAMGRDLFAMIWHGGRVSLTIGLLATLISTLTAVVFGAFSGVAPNRIDSVMMRCAELLLSVPSLLTVVFLQAIWGKASVLSISLALGLTEWMGMAKVVRAEVRQLRSSEYVVASRSMGGGFFHVLKNHLAPNFFPSVLFMVVMNVRSAVIAESTLSFMGVGLPVETISWGSMLANAERALLSGAWWVILVPGIFLTATLMSVTEIGNALHRSVDG